jgi:hypothetical protein
MILGVIITASTLYGVTFLNIGTGLSAPFIPAKGFGSRHHGDEPFSVIELLKLMAGVFSVILILNAGEYAFERITSLNHTL